ncbi:MAG: pyridoxal-phosphate dependent enzyme [Cyclobacteriaceae bacterium]|nr:1-aminocyclopropane-1-carboxylate deaminase/D-cysteine desulfhydrase [Cyclobacteriaceae bacterium]MCB9237794.1 1-aminocyclopropane-1-carboxylate deaminase/D-cysteine desulfhydrase [Flammeovirgaceae bacterium]MCB0498694.1 1-aminocyclopropane-1-carboxylate deaminase/D-cysteine desulfhydrase [Cyclobacteriaceae bacterium]MCO5270103.1 pyridoxal-phosphate dependent enzyme [Cyclobacteriaceae bacterium]MCW5903157.1 1-aminocyclopropane-1-carboxylate deaminase/D-cysteine desulfhydrase [Cyclobacteriace
MVYTPTPVVRLKSPFLEKKEVTVLVKREDLNHPHVSGNKWWKLKYNLEEAIGQGHDTLLTFGGPYSNHVYATAAAANENGLKGIGIIRGEETLPLNATLSFAKRQGMAVHYVSRERYRGKTDPRFVQGLRNRFGNFYLIPEGGTNGPAIKGCEEWARELGNTIGFDCLCLPVGTGGTMAGMVRVLTDKQVVGFSSLKGGGFLDQEVGQWAGDGPRNWRIETGYHFGGYGKAGRGLMDFILEFEKAHQVPLDPVYTGKMMFGVFDLIAKGAIGRGKRVLALHTGGLQGRAGFNF